MTALRSVSFTASRTLSQRAAEGVVTSVLTVHVPHADRYLTGACTGGDAFIGRWLCEHRPDAEHVVIVPADRSRVEEWWAGLDVTVIEMPFGSTYADRNARLVAEAGAVFAFPAYPENDPRSLRSGTWQTARMARHVGNFSQWHCVTPPYRGMIERRTEELLGGDAGDAPECELGLPPKDCQDPAGASFNRTINQAQDAGSARSRGEGIIPRRHAPWRIGIRCRPSR